MTSPFPMFSPQPATSYRPMPDSAVSKPLKFTLRQVELIQHVAHGKSDQDVADLMGIKLQSVRNRMGVLFNRLGACNRVSLVRRAMEVGLIDPPNVTSKAVIVVGMAPRAPSNRVPPQVSARIFAS